MNREKLKELIKRFEHNAEYERTHGNLQGCLEFTALADDLKRLEKLENLKEQEQFINKPCVSSEVCEHDKNVVLDKLRSELHATAEMHEDGDYYLRNEWIDEYFDKYMESEDNNVRKSNNSNDN